MTLRYDMPMNISAKKTFLILGSSGQIGSALAERVKKNGDHVIEFDLVRSPEEDIRVHGNARLEAAMKQADFVFFLAFDVGGSRYLKTYQNTYDFVSNNIKIIDRTFDLLHKYRKPFIFASSQMANMSYSSYGLLKSTGEKVTEILGGVVVKFWNVYGLETDLEKSHVITDLIIKAATKKEIDLLTDGTEERQFLYADDCCECLLTLMEQYGTIVKDRPLHITNFKWHTVLQVADIIASHFPGSKITPSKQTDEVQKNKRNEPDPYILNYWKPKTELEDGIAEIVKEMKKNPELYFNSAKKSESQGSASRITVITHCDNRKEHLRHFLKELPNQTLFRRLEVVLYHTSPDDEEMKWIADFNKTHHNIIKHVVVTKQDSVGVSMNFSLQKATGDFITMWNVDDIRTHDSLEQQVAILQKNPEIGVVYGDYKVVTSFGKTDGKIVSDALIEDELTRSMIIGPFFMFRKSLLKKVGMFDEQLRSGADFDFAVRLGFHTKFARTSGILGSFFDERMRPESHLGSLQTLERTVVELRYGIYDKIDYDYVGEAEKYSVGQLKVDGKWTSVASYVPSYEKLLENRKAQWYSSGVMKYNLKKATGYKSIRAIAKKAISIFR
jgi:nucleoside-diphosphate-sugar epimerase/glycosyltransferase involved in cell wall biosynthesis